MDDRVGGMVVTEEDRTFVVDVKERGKFTLKIPYPLERSTIAAVMSQLLGGAPLESIPPEDVRRVRVLATLSTVITESPDGFNVERYMDEDVLFHLYGEWLKKDEAFRSKLKKNQFVRRPVEKTD